MIPAPVLLKTAACRTADRHVRTGMAITIKTGVVYYTMLEYVKKNFSCILSVQDHGEGCGCADEIYDTVQTMNISQTLNYSILLIIMEAFSLIVYLATDFTGRAVSMLSFTMLLFLLFIALNIVYCKYLLKQQRTCSTRRRLKHHTYFSLPYLPCTVLQ